MADLVDKFNERFENIISKRKNPPQGRCMIREKEPGLYYWGLSSSKYPVACAKKSALIFDDYESAKFVLKKLNAKFRHWEIVEA